MKTSSEGTFRSPHVSRTATRVFLLWLALAAGAGSTGCAALTNPVADGIPVNRLPPELLGTSKADLVPLPLTSLGQKQPDAYRLAPGDVLGIWIEGVLGEKNQPPPVTIPQQGNLTPALGYPIPVRDNGTLPLPIVEPVRVQGLTLDEAEAAIRTAYTVTKKILLPGQDRMYVSLMRPREYHVLVIREEAQGSAVGAAGIYGGSGAYGYSPSTVSFGKQGTGYRVDLPAYQNDVMNALAQTGGFPGLDAANEIVIYRDTQGQALTPDKADALCKSLHASGDPGLPGAGLTGQVIRIPLRLRPGRAASFPTRRRRAPFRGHRLHSGTHGRSLLYRRAPGDRLLPRAEGQRPGRASGHRRRPGTACERYPGLEQPFGVHHRWRNRVAFPSLLSVLRKTRDGGQVNIRVDLNLALRDPRERILVQPGDMLILQETLGEALAVYFTEVFKFAESYTIENDTRSHAAAGVALP